MNRYDVATGSVEIEREFPPEPAVVDPSPAANRRVGLITAHGWVGISTPVLMTARYLAQSEFEVDLFIEEDPSCQELGIALPEFKEANIRVLRFSRQNPLPETSPVAAGITAFDLSFFQRARKIAGDYKWLVGFDPQGLIRAALLGDLWRVPFVYHSLEIHDKEDDLKRLEREFSRRALLTVTQDEIRADLLASINGISRERVAVVYNSSLGDILPGKHDHFREKFSIPSTERIVLAAGTLLPHHGIDRIICAAPSWPSGFVLVLHGWIPDHGFEKSVRRQCAAHPGRIFLSTDLLPAEEKSIVFQSVDIGLVFFSPDDTNLTYASGSSGKIFDFMQAGVPIMANDLPGMRELIEGNGCGRVVPQAEDIGVMLPAVMNDYASLREGALRSFGRYGFAASYKSLLEKIAVVTSVKAGNTHSARPGTQADDEVSGVIRIVQPYTKLGAEHLRCLYSLARTVCRENIAGNFLACGPAACGASALLAFVAKRYSRTSRKVFCCGFLSEMPVPGRQDSLSGRGSDVTGWGNGVGGDAIANLRQACAELKVSDGVVAIPGNLEDVLPRMRDWLGMIALLHIGESGYESTRCIFNNLSERLVNDARLQVDGFGLQEGSSRALREFEARQGLRFDLQRINDTGVHFVNPIRSSVNTAIPDRMVAEFHRDDPVRCGIESQMSANERFQLYYAIRHLALQQTRLFRFIEIGSYAGASFYLICAALQRMEATFQGIAVEPGGQPQFREVISRFRDNAIHLPCLSHDAAGRLAHMLDKDNLPEFILIDGDHSYGGVRQDILDYFPLLSPGGIMMFHDYLPPLDDRNRAFVHAHHAHTEPGIRRACQELIEKAYGLPAIDLPLLYPEDLSQTQAHLPLIPGVRSTVRAYRKPLQ